MPLYKGPSDKAGAGAKRSLVVGEDDNENGPKKRMLYGVKDEGSDRSIAPNLYNSNAPATQDIPALPEIRNPATETLVFTHPSTTNRQINSYERLEWYGDAVIEMVSTDLIFETYPNLVGGRLSQVRESLVNNARLATFSCNYGLDKRIHLDKKFDKSGPSYTKILGDVFEAYVGAIALEDKKTSESRAEKWLRELWQPLLLNNDLFLDEDETNQDQVKLEANRTFAPSGSGLKATFVDLFSGMQNKAQQKFRVGYYLNGWGHDKLFLSEGEGQNKKIARARAAKNALVRARTDPVLVEHTKMTKKYVEDKRKAKEAANAANAANAAEG